MQTIKSIWYGTREIKLVLEGKLYRVVDSKDTRFNNVYYVMQSKALEEYNKKEQEVFNVT